MRSQGMRQDNQAKIVVQRVSTYVPLHYLIPLLWVMRAPKKWCHTGKSLNNVMGIPSTKHPFKWCFYPKKVMPRYKVLSKVWTKSRMWIPSMRPMNGLGCHLRCRTITKLGYGTCASLCKERVDSNNSNPESKYLATKWITYSLESLKGWGI